jgi:hypothetical protein
LVVEVEVEGPIEISFAEIDSRTRRSPSHAACERGMPPLVVMRPCAVLEEGHAWSRGERGLKARQPLAAKGRDKQVRPRSSLELFFLETTLFSFRPSAASSFHSNRFSFSTVSRSLLSSTSTMGGGNAQKSAISRAKNAAKAASAGKGTPLRREREKKGLIHFFLQAVEAAPPPLLSFSPSSSLTASSSSSSSSLQQPKKKTGSRLKDNAAALSIICQVCRSTFLCTSTRPKLEEHIASKHAKGGSFEGCFPGFAG